ncbi:hypothetical protein RI367_002260 [Sorochytrium milnesiophthora]
MAPLPCFVYGTLQSATVWQTVTNAERTPASVPAVLRGYKRYRVKNAYYPAILRTYNDDDHLQGRLVTVDSDATVDRLDRFEGADYQRHVVPVDVQRANGQTEQVVANVYVWRGDRQQLDLDGPDWSLQDFLHRNGFAGFEREMSDSGIAIKEA